MVVTSVAVSFAVFNSPPPATLTLFVTLDEALLPTLTVRVIAGYDAPPASASLRKQVRVATVHVHPVPLIAVAVRPAGSVSITVTRPLVGPPPALLTVMV